MVSKIKKNCGIVKIALKLGMSGRTGLFREGVDFTVNWKEMSGNWILWNE